MTTVIKRISSLPLLATHIEQFCSNNSSISNCKKYLDNYVGDDWKKYILTHNNKQYSRNKVLERDNFDIYVLTWNPMSHSKIHDHPKAGCLMRVMSGDLFEYKYKYINDKLHTTSYNIINKNNYTSYIHDTIGYHAVGNSSDEIGVSIHIYSPKNYIPNVIYK
jgi:predicted metal-dependent enzyme (double-stranded beta helix superfamily)